LVRRECLYVTRCGQARRLALPPYQEKKEKLFPPLFTLNSRHAFTDASWPAGGGKETAIMERTPAPLQKERKKGKKERKRSLCNNNPLFFFHSQRALRRRKKEQKVRIVRRDCQGGVFFSAPAGRGEKKKEKGKGCRLWPSSSHSFDARMRRGDKVRPDDVVLALPGSPQVKRGGDGAEAHPPCFIRGPSQSTDL